MLSKIERLTGIRHQSVETPKGCGAACFAMIMDIPQKDAARLCKTKHRGTDTGTHTGDVVQAFMDCGVDAHSIDIGMVDYGNLWWLEALSLHFPLYVSARYRSGSMGKRPGRDILSHHAVVIAAGHIFDGTEDSPIPLAAAAATFDKAFEIREIVLVGKELPCYGKGMEIDMEDYSFKV